MLSSNCYPSVFNDLALSRSFQRAPKELQISFLNGKNYYACPFSLEQELALGFLVIAEVEAVKHWDKG